MGPKILVVDDSTFARQILRKALNHRGFREVIEAENGEEALRKYATEKPDVVLLDVVMPGLEGTNVLKKVMNMDENAKVIMLSSVDQEKTVNLCNKLGSVGYIVKPFEYEQLVAVLEKALGVKGKIESSVKLTKLEEDALREIGHVGAQHVATALSKMIGQTVNAKLLAAKMVSLAKLPNLVGDRELMVSGIYLPVTGNISGSILLVFPQKSALILVDLLLKRELGTTKQLDEIDKSALSEAGNILAGNCLTALSQVLVMNLVEHVPDFAYGMAGALIDNIAVTFGQKAERALTMQLELSTKTKVKVAGYFFLMFASKETNAILKAIRTKAGV